MFKKVFKLTVLSLLSFFVVYAFFTPVLVSGLTVTPTGTATPTLAINQEINVTSPGTVTMTPSIGGLTGNYQSPASGSATFTITSNSASGYTMTLQADQSHALHAGTASTQYFLDYVPVVPGTPDYSWKSPASNTAWFGFAIYSDHAVQAFQTNETVCNVATINVEPSHCWVGFNGTTPINAVDSSVPSVVAGEDATVYFRAEFNNPSLGSQLLQSGSYTATVTATVASN